MKETASKRLFTGIPLIETLRCGLEQFQKEYSGLPDIRWTPAANLHITICFLGDTPVTEIPGIIERIKKTAREFVPFRIQFEKITPMPDSNRPSMIWARYHLNEKFSELCSAISGTLNINPDHKQFIPHITIARIKKHKKVVLPEFEYVPAYKTLLVNKLVLWESVLSEKGAEYYEMAEVVL